MGRIKSVEAFETLQKTISVANTPEFVIDGTTHTDAVLIKAFLNNDDVIYFGDDSVTSSDGYAIFPGEALSLEIDNFKSNLYITSPTTGVGVYVLHSIYRAGVV
jgi:hypothetical protein